MEYFHEFERSFLELNPAQFGWKDRIVSVRESKLKSHTFGQILGTVFQHSKPCAFDYYGLQRKSTGLINKLADSSDLNTIVCPVLHFQSIKIEHILEVNPELIHKFAEFKTTLLKIRGFK
jgi:hypothetical protein